MIIICTSDFVASSKGDVRPTHELSKIACNVTAVEASLTPTTRLTKLTYASIGEIADPWTARVSGVTALGLDI